MKLFRILAGGLCFAVVIGFLSVVFFGWLCNRLERLHVDWSTGRQRN